MFSYAQTSSEEGRDLYRDVKRSYEWTLEEWQPNLWSQKFVSRTEDVRDLEWQIKIKGESPGVSNGIILSAHTYSLSLNLLTDIEDEVNVTYSFSLKSENSQFLRSNSLIFEDTKTNKFKRGNDRVTSKIFYNFVVNSTSTGGPWKLTCELNYLDKIREMESCSDEVSVCELLGDLENVLENPVFSEFSDVTICVQGRKYKAHKFMLAIRSPVFAEMLFRPELLSDNQIVIDDLEPQTFEEMLKFIYTARTPNLTKMAEQLLIAANLYKIETLKVNAEKELLSAIRVDNARILLILADKYAVPELKTRALKFIAENLEELLSEDGEKSWEIVIEGHARLFVLILREVVQRRPIPDRPDLK